MQTNVLLPQVELTMEQVRVLRWLVGVGTEVQAEQGLLEVETQKATVEVPSPCSGFVRMLYVNEGDSIGEKTLLCVVTDTADEKFEDPSEAMPAAGSSARSEQNATAENIAALEIAESGAIRATPAARRVAKELGVELSAVTGTGPGGRITDQDVRDFREQNSS